MSITLDELLLNWINWYIPDGGDLASIQEARQSSKMQKAYDRLFPIELRPTPSDPLEYVYTAIACYIKSFNHGPDKFTPPQFTNDENRNMKTLLMNLFLLFKIVEGDKTHFEDEEPAWYTNLCGKFALWDRISSTTTEFPLPILIANYKSQVEQRREEVDHIKADLHKLELDIQSKIERKKETYDALLASQTEELSAAESVKQQLLNEQKSLEGERLRIMKQNEEYETTKNQIAALEKEQEELNSELEKLRNDEKELAQIKIDLSGMEQIDLKNRCEQEKMKQVELEEEEKQLIASLEKEIDYTERDQLIKEVDLLQKKADETNPDKIKKLWNNNLDREIQKTQLKIQKLQKILQLGTDLISED